MPTDFISRYTDYGQIILPTSAAVYALFKEDYKGIGWMAISIAVNQIGIEVLKKLFNTARPNNKKHAFPSGHTGAAFLGPSFLMLRYQMPITFSPVILSSFLAGTVGIGRVWVKAHWTSDVLGGALLGYAVVKIIVPPLVK